MHGNDARLRHLGDRSAGDRAVLANRVLVGGTVYAVGPLVAEIGVNPFDRVADLRDRGVRLLRDRLFLGIRERPDSGDFPLDDERLLPLARLVAGGLATSACGRIDVLDLGHLLRRQARVLEVLRERVGAVGLVDRVSLVGGAEVLDGAHAVGGPQLDVGLRIELDDELVLLRRRSFAGPVLRGPPERQHARGQHHDARYLHGSPLPQSTTRRQARRMQPDEATRRSSQRCCSSIHWRQRSLSSWWRRFLRATHHGAEKVTTKTTNIAGKEMAISRPGALCPATTREHEHEDDRLCRLASSCLLATSLAERWATTSTSARSVCSAHIDQLWKG